VKRGKLLTAHVPTYLVGLPYHGSPLHISLFSPNYILLKFVGIVSSGVHPSWEGRGQVAASCGGGE